MKSFCVWFPSKPKKAKLFTTEKIARKFIKTQKEECYLNSNCGKENEDTILGKNSNL